MVVFVARRDKWKKRAKQNLEFLENMFTEQEKDGKDVILNTIMFPLLDENGEMSAFKHTGFYQPMDTLNDKNYLQKLWDNGNPPWRR